MKKGEKKTAYEAITQRFIDCLDKGDVPWVKPWAGGSGLTAQINFVSGRTYKGMLNILLLNMVDRMSVV